LLEQYTFVVFQLAPIKPVGTKKIAGTPCFSNTGIAFSMNVSKTIVEGEMKIASIDLLRAFQHRDARICGCEGTEFHQLE
jgi:hypothetical protein